MGIYKKEEIAAITIGEDLICFDCINEEDWEDIEEGQITTRADIERDDETFYFCDRCKTKI